MLHGSLTGPAPRADLDTVPCCCPTSVTGPVTHAGVTLTVERSVHRQLLARQWSPSLGLCCYCFRRPRRRAGPVDCGPSPSPLFGLDTFQPDPVLEQQHVSSVAVQNGGTPSVYMQSTGQCHEAVHHQPPLIVLDETDGPASSPASFGVHRRGDCRESTVHSRVPGRVLISHGHSDNCTDALPPVDATDTGA